MVKIISETLYIQYLFHNKITQFLYNYGNRTLTLILLGKKSDA